MGEGGEAEGRKEGGGQRRTGRETEEGEEGRRTRGGTSPALTAPPPAKVPGRRIPAPPARPPPLGQPPRKHPGNPYGAPKGLASLLGWALQQPQNQTTQGWQLCSQLSPASSPPGHTGCAARREAKVLPRASACPRFSRPQPTSKVSGAAPRHITDEETEARSSKMTCSGPQLGLEPGEAGWKVPGLKNPEWGVTWDRVIVQRRESSWRSHSRLGRSRAEFSPMPFPPPLTWRRGACI